MEGLSVPDLTAAPGTHIAPRFSITTQLENVMILRKDEDEKLKQDDEEGGTEDSGLRTKKLIIRMVTLNITSSH